MVNPPAETDFPHVGRVFGSLANNYEEIAVTFDPPGYLAALAVVANLHGHVLSGIVFGYRHFPLFITLRTSTEHVDSPPASAFNLSWEKKSHLTLTQRSASEASAVLRAPAEIEDNPPLIAFHPAYLADALEIGRLSVELSPGICRHPSGRFCVIMPMRVTIATAVAVQAEAANAA